MGENNDVERSSSVRAAFFTFIIPGVLGIIGGLISVSVQGQNEREAFMRTQRSEVYANYLESAVEYQNRLNSYMEIVPVWEEDERKPIDLEDSRERFSAIMEARQNYVVQSMQASILQGEDAQMIHGELEKSLHGAYEKLEANKTKNIQEVDSGLNNQEITEIMSKEFNNDLNNLRGSYISIIREDFKEE